MYSDDLKSADGGLGREEAEWSGSSFQEQRHLLAWNERKRRARKCQKFKETGNRFLIAHEFQDPRGKGQRWFPLWILCASGHTKVLSLTSACHVEAEVNGSDEVRIRPRKEGTFAGFESVHCSHQAAGTGCVASAITAAPPIAQEPDDFWGARWGPNLRTPLDLQGSGGGGGRWAPGPRGGGCGWTRRWPLTRCPPNCWCRC